MSMKNPIDYSAILEDAKKYPPREYNATIDIIGDPMINPMTLKQMLLNPSAYDDEAIMLIFRNKYADILHDTALLNTYWNLFTERKYLEMFISVLSNSPYGYEERLYANKICVNFKEHCPVEKYNELYLVILHNLGGMVNIRDIREIAAAVPELEYDKAITLAVLRAHDTNPTIAYRAINDYICTLDPAVTSPSNIVKIYESMGNYGSISISALLSVVMLSGDKRFATENEAKVDANILYAVLSILNECPTASIEHAIMKYNMDFAAYSNRAKGPISGFAKAFPRLDSVINKLRSQGYTIY